MYIMYTKGFCDDKLIATIKDNSSFKQQAHYHVKCHQLIDQVRCHCPEVQFD
jgi:hypothetical protein